MRWTRRDRMSGGDVLRFGRRLPRCGESFGKTRQETRGRHVSPMVDWTQMMRKQATIQTINDIAKSIKSFGDVDVRPDEESGSVVITAWPFTIRVKQHETLFHWTLRAKDDPTDNDEGYASDPLDEIVDSLSEETPGREIWKQVSSSPKKLAAFLRRAAANPTAENVLILKRVAGFLLAGSNPAVTYLLDLHEKSIHKIMRDMESRRWVAEEIEDDSGLPAVTFEIGEEYEGKIMLAKVMYEYAFSVENNDHLTEKGTSDNVVGSLRKWAKRPDVDEAASEIEADSFEDKTTRPVAVPEETKTPVEGLRGKKK